MDESRIAPQPGGQTLFLTCDAFEAFFGGVAGPGKSWSLVVDAQGLQFAHTPLLKAAIEVPEYRAVLFRRKSTQLSQLLDEAHKYYPILGGTYTAQRKGDPGACYQFPSGAKIFFCHMENEMDKENHQGLEYQYVGFDELPQFSITQYLYLFSRCRSKIDHLFARVRSTGNPVGSGLVAVRKRFITNQKPYEVGYFLSDSDPKINPQGVRVPKGTPDALSRVFIPGILAENRFADPMYPARIKAMGKTMEKALLQGDWDAFGGDFMPEFDRSTMLIDPCEIPKEWRLIGSIDPGFSSPCSFSLRAVDFEGNHYRVATYYESQRSPETHAKEIKTFIKDCPWTHGRMPEMIVAGRDAWAKRDKYAVTSSEVTFADVFQHAGLLLRPATTDRIPGWWAIRNLMEQKKWFVFKTLNQPFLEELAGATRDPNHPEDIYGRGNDPDVADHALDEERYSTMAVYTPKRARQESKGWADVLAKQAAEQTNWRPGQG